MTHKNASKHTIKNLQAIARDHDNFFALYEWDEVRPFQFTLPVYTGGLTAKQERPIVSRTLRSVNKSTRTVHEIEKIMITRDDAEAFVDAAQVTNMIALTERLFKNVWVVRIKGVRA